MIEFQIQVDSRIIQAILPQIEKIFANASRSGGLAYACPNPMDEDFVEAWESGLKEEFLNDRKALACLLRNPKFKHGYIEVEDEKVDELLRSLTELRLTLRDDALSEISDEQLEQGDVDLHTEKSSVRIGYFAYLVMAEIQESLISESS
jgi:hypothetical protein